MMWLHPLRLAFFLVGCLLLFPAQGAELRLSAAPSHALAGHMDVLVDPSAQAGIEDVIAGRAGDFVSLPGEFGSRFTQAAVWFRLPLRREAGDPVEWWLEIENRLLEDVSVYQPNPAGGFDESRASVNPAVSTRDRDAPVRLHLLADGPQSVYVRIQSQTSLVTSLRLWQPEAYVRTAVLMGEFWGIYFGVYLLIALIYLVLWRSTREPTQGWYLLYVVTTLALAFQDRGWEQQALPPAWQVHSNTLMWLTLCAAIAAMVTFTSSYLGLAQRFRRGNRIYLGLAYGATGGAALAVLGGYPQQAMQFVQPAALLIIMVSVGMAIRLLRRGDIQARVFLLAFSLLYVGVLLRFARNLGLAEFGAWSTYSYRIGALVHMLVLSIGLFWGYARLRMEKQAAEARVASEQRQREEEREFMAMISHEFRTPLGVIGASADNLLRSQRLNDKDSAKCEKILRANERLTTLMDNYLSAERLGSADIMLQKTPVDMVSLCTQVMGDFEGSPGAAIELHRDSDALICVCDDGLVRLALRNLLQNARRHSPPERPVHIHLRETSRHMLLSVRDEGEGIPPEEVPLVFKRYFRGRGAVHRPGAGLGLHLVTKVAQSHGGRVSVESRLGAYCEFCLRLPK